MARRQRGLDCQGGQMRVVHGGGQTSTRGSEAPATESCVLGDTGRAAIGLWSQDSLENMLNRAAPPQALRVS